MAEDANPRPESFYFDRIEGELRGLSDLHWQRSLDKRRRPEFIQWTGAIPITLTVQAVSSVFPNGIPLNWNTSNETGLANNLPTCTLRRKKPLYGTSL